MHFIEKSGSVLPNSEATASVKGLMSFSKSAQQLYRKLFDREIEIITIHAGLECAIFAQKIKGIDAISIGPDMWDVHTANEKLSISSTRREWQYLLELLKL